MKKCSHSWRKCGWTLFRDFFSGCRCEAFLGKAGVEFLVIVSPPKDRTGAQGDATKAKNRVAGNAANACRNPEPQCDSCPSPFRDRQFLVAERSKSLK